MKPQILLRSVLLIALIFSLHSAFAQPLARAEVTLCSVIHHGAFKTGRPAVRFRYSNQYK